MRSGVKGFLPVLVCLLAGVLEGCAYRLPAPSPPAREYLRLVVKSPETYLVHLDFGPQDDYKVPPDGRVVFTVPSYRASCGVYLFDSIKVSGSKNPLNGWTISVIAAGRTVRRFSVRQLRELASDSEGYHLLKIPQ